MIHQAMEVEVRIGGEQLGDQRHVRRPHQLVGHQHPAHALGLGGYLDIGLHDTMEDLLVNFIGAVVFCTFGFFYLKGRGKGKFVRRFVPTMRGVCEEDVKGD